MRKPKFMVGGEFVFSPGIIFEKDYHQFSNFGANLEEYNRYYTFGAYYSLKAIIQSIGFDFGDSILLPSYLCPTMIYPFKEAGIKYDFYKMKEGLLPDLDDIDRKIRKGLKAVLFVDYFGHSYKNYLAEIVSILRTKGIVTIQDTVQSWLNNENTLYGDFCMNSVRKYSPFEASVLHSKTPMKFQTQTKPIRKFILHKRYGQFLRFCHIKYGCFKPERFLRHIDIANQSYHVKGIVAMPKSNAWFLDRIDFTALSRKRSIVYHSLLRNLELQSVVKVDLCESTPLGLPVYLEDRNQKKADLHRLNIHCPVHWFLSDEIDRQEHQYSWDMQNHILTIPINISLTLMSEYITRLKEVL